MMTIPRFERGRLHWCLPIASALLAACSSQVQSDYPGEPIASLRGKVTAQKASLQSDVTAAIVWSQITSEFFGERVDVQGSFPASFELDLFEPPPAEAETKTFGDYCVRKDGSSGGLDADDRCDGQLIPAGTRMGFWLGYIVALDASVADGELDAGDVVGADPEHFIVYFDHDELDEDDLPDDPTAEQLAKHMKLLDPDYIGSRDKGYHLGKVNPEYHAQRRERRECRWQGLCVHWTVDEAQQSQADWEYERCTALFPENPTCEAIAPGPTGPPENEPAPSVACREQYDALGNDCRGIVSADRLIENPADLDDPITIQLGVSFWDAASWSTPY